MRQSLQMTDWDAWVARCRTLLESNQISSGGYRYTRPAPKVYEYQWLWDSCFHAITYRWFDGQMAWDELHSLVHHQVTDGADAGMIAHMTYWRGDGAEMWGREYQSIITQPPLIAIAAWLVHEKHPDLDALRTLYPALVRYHEWFERRRDPDNDGLVTLIHPWESGWDASPRWDAAMGLHHPTDEESKAARHALVKTLQGHQTDASALEDAESFAVEAADFNAIRAADLEALGRIADAIGEDGALWRAKAAIVQLAIRDKILRQHDDGTFIVHDLSGADERAASPDSAAKFILLFGGCVTDEQAAALVAELDSSGFQTTYPVTTTPTDDPRFAGSHYWRGNVWLAVNWLIYRGLQRYGYDAEAQRIAERSLALVDEHGFHEYFDPISGAGQGPDQQSWSAIVLDMLGSER